MIKKMQDARCRIKDSRYDSLKSWLENYASCILHHVSFILIKEA